MLHIFAVNVVIFILFCGKLFKLFVFQSCHVKGLFCLDVYINMRDYTSPGEGLRNTRPGGGGHILPPAISAPRNARNTKLGGWVGPYKKSLWCKFGDPRSASSRSNDVINAKFSHFLVKRAALCFSRSRAQTKTDSFKLQKKEDAQ